MSAGLHRAPRTSDDVLHLTDELRRIASKIRDAAPSRRAAIDTGLESDGFDHLALAEALLLARRRIGNHFSPILFADPARDLLLDLYASGLRGKVVSVSSACIAAGVPATTALRWIRKLEADGLIALERDRTDNRRVIVRLSEAGATGMQAYLSEIAMLLSLRR